MDIDWPACLMYAGNKVATDTMKIDMAASYAKRSRADNAAFVADRTLRRKIDEFGGFGALSPTVLARIEQTLLQEPVARPELEKEIRSATAGLFGYMREYLAAKGVDLTATNSDLSDPQP